MNDELIGWLIVAVVLVIPALFIGLATLWED